MTANISIFRGETFVSIGGMYSTSSHSKLSWPGYAFTQMRGRRGA